jgi:hypothetical protein
MKQTDDAVKYITNTLKGILHGNYAEIPIVQLYSHYTESTLISLLNANRLGMLNLDDEDYSVVLKQIVNLGLLSTEIATFYEEHKAIIQENLQYDNDADWDNPQAIHEGLLSCELNISANDVWFSAGKISRDATGSYYTPSNLAIEVVREAIEKYLNTRKVNSDSDAVLLLSETKFADLSCGCGEFIKAVQKYLLERYQISPENTGAELPGHHRRSDLLFGYATSHYSGQI